MRERHAHPTPWVRQFFGDLRDRGAEPNKDRAATSDHFAGVVTGLTALAGMLDVVGKTLQDLVGLPGVFAHFALLLVALSECVYIVSARKPERAVHPTYRFGTPLRSAGKVLALLLVVYGLPREAMATAEHYSRVPEFFGGYLVDARNGMPVANARVRLLLNTQVDIGGATWASDSSGFYIVQLQRSVLRKDAILLVYADTCGTHKLSLAKDFESGESTRMPGRGKAPASRAGAEHRPVEDESSRVLRAYPNTRCHRS